jgi:hypothetical protein
LIETVKLLGFITVCRFVTALLSTALFPLALVATLLRLFKFKRNLLLVVFAAIILGEYFTNGLGKPLTVLPKTWFSLRDRVNGDIL